jgi:hypothetical protein
MTLFRMAFSRPVNSGLKPAPSSSKAAMRPLDRTVPTVGSSVRQISCSKVDLPLPFWPMMPTVSPLPMASDTSRSAQNSR